MDTGGISSEPVIVRKKFRRMRCGQDCISSKPPAKQYIIYPMMIRIEALYFDTSKNYLCCEK
jgi:hypothetical protein